MNPELLDLLTELLDYMDNKADCDVQGDPPDYVPNTEMKLQTRIQDYINSHE